MPRRAPLTPPEPFRPKAFRFTQLRLSEPFVADTPPDPKTLCGEHSSRSEDPSSRTLHRIRRPLVANTPPNPGSLRRGRPSRSEDPLSRTLLEIRGPFVAGAPQDPRTPCYARPAGSDDPLLRKITIGIKRPQRNRKIHFESNFLWINCCKTCGKPEGCRFVKALHQFTARSIFAVDCRPPTAAPRRCAPSGPWPDLPAHRFDSSAGYCADFPSPVTAESAPIRTTRPAVREN